MRKRRRSLWHHLSSKTMCSYGGNKSLSAMKQEVNHLSTWAQMKDVMRARFVLTYYKRDLFKKLQLLKQGTKSVEEDYKEMEIAMIRASVKEDDEQTMTRFLNGLNHPIKKIADFQPYSNLIELVHQATKAERQVQDDFKYAKYSSKTYGFSKKSSFNNSSNVCINQAFSKQQRQDIIQESFIKFKSPSSYYKQLQATCFFLYSDR